MSARYKMKGERLLNFSVTSSHNRNVNQLESYFSFHNYLIVLRVTAFELAAL